MSTRVRVSLVESAHLTFAWAGRHAQTGREKGMHFEELSNEEWSLVGPILTAHPRAGVLRRGRPRIRTRVVANAVLWVLTTGQSWSKLPAHYPSQPTCRCRFEAWRLDGKLAGMIRILSEMGRSFAYVP